MSSVTVFYYTIINKRNLIKNLTIRLKRSMSLGKCPVYELKEIGTNLYC